MISAFGNHDWNGDRKSNRLTKGFVQDSYAISKSIAPDLSYEFFFPIGQGPNIDQFEAPPIVTAKFRGINLVNCMSDPFQGALPGNMLYSSQYPEDKNGNTIHADYGKSAFEASHRTIHVQAKEQFHRATSSLNRKVPTIFMQHYPINRMRSNSMYSMIGGPCPKKVSTTECSFMSNYWVKKPFSSVNIANMPAGCYYKDMTYYFNDHPTGASNPSAIAICSSGTQQTYIDTIKEFDYKSVFSGHVHSSDETFHDFDFIDYTANYGRNGFYAVLVSPQRGVLEVQDMLFDVNSACTEESPCTTKTFVIHDIKKRKKMSTQRLLGLVAGSGSGMENDDSVGGSVFEEGVVVTEASTPSGVNLNVTEPTMPALYRDVYAQYNKPSSSEDAENATTPAADSDSGCAEHGNGLQYEYEEVLSEKTRFVAVHEPLFVVYGEFMSLATAQERCTNMCSALAECAGITLFLLPGVDGRYQCNGVDSTESDEEDISFAPAASYRKVLVGLAVALVDTAGTGTRGAAAGSSLGTGVIVGVVCGCIILLVIVGLIYKRSHNTRATRGVTVV